MTTLATQKFLILTPSAKKCRHALLLTRCSLWHFSFAENVIPHVRNLGRKDRSLRNFISPTMTQKYQAKKKWTVPNEFWEWYPYMSKMAMIRSTNNITRDIRIILSTYQCCFILDTCKPYGKAARRKLVIKGYSNIKWKIWNINLTDSSVLGQH